MNDAPKPGDFLITVAVKNARLLRAMRAAGYPTASALARAAGIEPSRLCEFLALKRAPYLASGDPSLTAQRLCGVLNARVEDLFPPSFLHRALERNKVVVEMTEDQVRQVMVAADRDPERNMLLAEGLATIDKALAGLPPRERRILRWRFGFDEPALTLAECGEREGVGRERIRGLEQQALRRLRRPARNGDIKVARELLAASQEP